MYTYRQIFSCRHSIETSCLEKYSEKKNKKKGKFSKFGQEDVTE